MKKKSKINTYLAGPMEYTNDNGLNWRLDFKERFAPLGIDCVIPSFEEAELIPDVDAFTELKKTDYKEYKRIIQLILEKDIEFVHTVDFLVTRWDGERMSGTVGEAQEAYLYAQKDNWLVTPQPLHEIPGWFGACMTDEFLTVDALIEFWERTNYLDQFRR